MIDEEILLRHAAGAGVDVREGVAATLAQLGSRPTPPGGPEPAG